MNPTVRDFVLRLAIVFGVLFAVGLLSEPNDRPHRATFADFLVAVERGDIEHAVLETGDNSIRAEGTDGRVYAVGYPPPYAAALVDELQTANVNVDVKPRGPAWLERALPFLILVVVIGGAWLVLRRRSAGGGAGPLEGFRRAPGARSAGG